MFFHFITEFQKGKGTLLLTSLFRQDNDYIANYFEDGDDFGAGSDDNIDEATY